MIRKTAKMVAHVLLFVLAVVVFYLGLGVGLTMNPTLGTLLWIVAFAIAGINLFWILRKTARGRRT